MPTDLLNWYFFSPWRRLNRLHFNTALGLISLPALLFTFIGMESSAANFLTSMLTLASSSNNPETLLTTLNTLNQPPTTPTTPSTFTILTGVIINLCQLLFIPACRMRLTDMGKSPKTSLILALLFNLSYAGALTAIFGLNLLPAAWLFGIITFVGYLWLCLAPSAPKVAPYERQTLPPQS